MKEPWGIHWFRRDLRVYGNAALRENWTRTRGRTVGLFCFDSKFLSRPDFSHNRFAFFLKTLEALREDFQSQGGDLLVVDLQPKDAFLRILDRCRKAGVRSPEIVTWGRDYEPFARSRDQEIEKLLHKNDVAVSHHRDHLLFEPHELKKASGESGYYQVYSPFSKQWFKLLSSPEGQERIFSHNNASRYFEKRKRRPDLFRARWNAIFPGGIFEDALAEFERKNEAQVSVPIPNAGFFAGFKALEEFRSKLSNYKRDRYIPALAATSRLSMFFKNGSLTITQAIQALKLANLDWDEKSGPAQFLRELVWREFYYSILFHRPDVENQSFLPRFRELAWENDEAKLERWKNGTTGFPIVDAGMRELLATGWMHNRVRMIVASFLTKDLLIDWRLGERHFMRLLLDGDLAVNNGGWQWAASTGCDPQPYFRVFNPWLQGEKFDPEGHYIRKYVPELKDAPARAFHSPGYDRSAWNYPEPIVDHALVRVRALALYRR